MEIFIGMQYNVCKSLFLGDFLIAGSSSREEPQKQMGEPLPLNASSG